MKRFLLLLALVAATATACNPVRPYAASVNGDVISTSLIDDEIHAISSNPRYAAVLDQELGGGTAGGGLHPAGANSVNSQYVSQLVYNRILVALIQQDLKRQHLTVTPEQRRTAEEAVRSGVSDPAVFDSLAANYREYLVNRQAQLNAVMATRNTPEAQQKYYNDDPQRFSEYCVRHILVDSKEKADAIRQRIVGGEDFAAIAKTDSLDNRGQGGGSAAKGGDLGCDTKEQLDQFVPEFRDAVYQLAPGAISQPVESQYGFHIIEVTSKKQPAFADVQASISRRLNDPTQFFADALAKAKIKVNPRYGDYEPADTVRGVPARVVPHEPVTLPEGKASTDGQSDTSGLFSPQPDTPPSQ